MSALADWSKYSLPRFDWRAPSSKHQIENLSKWLGVNLIQFSYLSHLLLDRNVRQILIFYHFLYGLDTFLQFRPPLKFLRYSDVIKCYVFLPYGVTYQMPIFQSQSAQGFQLIRYLAPLVDYSHWLILLRLRSSFL